MNDFIKIRIEQEVLNCLLVENTAYDRVSDLLNEELFGAERHKVIYRAVKAMADKGMIADYVLLHDYLKDRQQSDMAGGEEYLHQMMQNTVQISPMLSSSIQTLRQNMLRRKALQITKDAQNDILNNPDADPSELINHVAGTLLSIEMGASEKTMASINDCLIEWGDDQNKPPAYGIGTGLNDIDDMIGCLEAGDLIILAARPSMGKTALAVNILDHVVTKTPKAGLFISLEMPKLHITRRIISAKARVPIGNLRNRQLSDDDWSAITPAMAMLNSAKLYISDDSNQTVSNIKTLANELKRKHGQIGVICVDHLGLMGGLSATNRNGDIGEITKGLKILAKECQCAVILLCQLNRSVEQRPNKRPMMSDLRDSGNIEQDADLVFMLYRDEYYNKNSDFKGIAELIVAKQRNGGTGTVFLSWESQYSRFRNMRDHDPQAHTRDEE